jgi:hypothetical protein
MPVQREHHRRVGVRHGSYRDRDKRQPIGDQLRLDAVEQVHLLASLLRALLRKRSSLRYNVLEANCVHKPVFAMDSRAGVASTRAGWMPDAP